MIKLNTQNVGGFDNVVGWQLANQYLNSDPATIDIVTLPFGPQAISDAAYYQTADGVYVYGGANRNYEILCELWYFDITTRKWDKLWEDPTGLRGTVGSSMVVYNDRVYVIGGYRYDEASAKDVLVINLLNRSEDIAATALLNSLPIDLMDPGVTLYAAQSTAYITGGVSQIDNLGLVSDKVYALNLDTGVISEYGTLPAPVFGHGTAATTAGNIIGIIGGIGADEITQNDKYWVLDVDTTIITDVVNTLKLGSQISMVCTEADEFIAFGGTVDGRVVECGIAGQLTLQSVTCDIIGGVVWSEPYKSAFVFGGQKMTGDDSDTNTSITYLSLDGTTGVEQGTPCQRSHHAFCKKDDELIVGGGYSDSSGTPYTFNDLWAYDIVDGTYRQLPDLPDYRQFFDLVNLPGTRVLVFGGNINPGFNDTIDNPTWDIDITTGSYTVVAHPTINPPARFFASTISGGVYYVFGGNRTAGSYASDVNSNFLSMLNMSTMTWDVTDIGIVSHRKTWLKDGDAFWSLGSFDGDAEAAYLRKYIGGFDLADRVYNEDTLLDYAGPVAFFHRERLYNTLGVRSNESSGVIPRDDFTGVGYDSGDLTIDGLSATTGDARGLSRYDYRAVYAADAVNELCTVADGRMSILASGTGRLMKVGSTVSSAKFRFKAEVYVEFTPDDPESPDLTLCGGIFVRVGSTDYYFGQASDGAIQRHDIWGTPIAALDVAQYSELITLEVVGDGATLKVLVDGVEQYSIAETGSVSRIGAFSQGSLGGTTTHVNYFQGVDDEGNSLIPIGTGPDVEHVSRTINVYDFDTNTWSPVVPDYNPLYDMDAPANEYIEGSLYVVGGYTERPVRHGSSTIVQNGDVIIPVASAYVEISDLPEVTEDFAMTFSNYDYISRAFVEARTEVPDRQIAEVEVDDSYPKALDRANTATIFDVL